MPQCFTPFQISCSYCPLVSVFIQKKLVVVRIHLTFFFCLYWRWKGCTPRIIPEIIHAHTSHTCVCNVHMCVQCTATHTSTHTQIHMHKVSLFLAKWPSSYLAQSIRRSFLSLARVPSSIFTLTWISSDYLSQSIQP